MIKNYLELDKSERDKFIEFLNRNKTKKLSLKDIDKQFKTEEFDFGKGIIIEINDKDVVGTVSIILIEWDKKGIAYIIKPDINENVEDKKAALYGILQAAKEIAEKYGLRQIFLGTKDETIINSLTELNIEKQYSALRMILEDREVRYTTLNLVMLSEDNREEYLRIYNDAFNEVPNASTLTEREVDEYITEADENSGYFIVEVYGDKIGFFQYKIEEGRGEFDIGLIEVARGKGYGKQLLETAINLLNEKKAKILSLIIITKNTLAHDMYIRRGFKESELISEWFEI